MIYKWRKVEYEDDGVTRYQCLHCYTDYSIAGGHDYIYCPYCGITFEGQLKYDETKTGSYRKYLVPSLQRGRDRKVWRIETRLENNEHSNWKVIWEHSYINMSDELQVEYDREREYFETKYKDNHYSLELANIYLTLKYTKLAEEENERNWMNLKYEYRLLYGYFGYNESEHQYTVMKYPA